MTFQIAEWKEGDDPQLVIDFINEVLQDLLPAYSEPGWYTDDQIKEICKKYEPGNVMGESFTFYDGKIIHVEYKGVEITLAKMNMVFDFTFENMFINFREEYSYGTGKIYNRDPNGIRYESDIPGLEELQKVKGIDNQPISVYIQARIKDE